MLFTPIYKGKRKKMQIKETHIPRGKNWKKMVVDIKTGKKFLAVGRSCGLQRCFCDAEIFDIK